MFRTILIAAVTITIAVGGGSYSAWYAVHHFDGFDAYHVGAWTAYPRKGTAEADPYSRARSARDGALVLGAAEGIAFYAFKDSGGQELRRDCEYRIAGNNPPARFWTLHAADPDLTPLAARPNLLSALHSEEIVRRQDGNFSIAVSTQARPGNWLAVAGSGPMVLVMTLYDTPASGDSGLVGLKFPTITRVHCHA